VAPARALSPRPCRVHRHVALVFAGCGAIVTTAERLGALGVVGVGLVFFLVLLAAIATLGHVSGAHFNPGVSLSFFLTRHLPACDLGAYGAAQFTGATLAALLLLAIWPARPADLGATVPGIPVGRASSSRWSSRRC